MVLLWPLVSNSCPSPLSPMIYGPSATGTPFHLQNKNSLKLLHFNKALLDLYFIPMICIFLRRNGAIITSEISPVVGFFFFFLRFSSFCWKKIIRGSWIQIMILLEIFIIWFIFLKSSCVSIYLTQKISIFNLGIQFASLVNFLAIRKENISSEKSVLFHE